MAAADTVGEPRVHRHELLAALSRGIDLCMGQPMGHTLGQTYIALLLAERAGLDADARREVFHTSMLAWAGCHVDSLEQARWFGDDHRVKADIRTVDLADDRAAMAFMAHHVGAGQPWPQRRRTLAAFRVEGVRDAYAMFENHRLAAAALAEALGIPANLCTGADQVFERWDGNGEPRGLRGTEVDFSARAANLGDVVMAIRRAGGTDAAVAVARARRGTQLDPDLVDLFCDQADAIFAALTAVDAFDASMRLVPSLDDVLDDDRLDEALGVLADYVDLKSPTLLGHQSATAELVDAAAEVFGLGTSERSDVRRAALLHDLGRLGVPAAVWESPGPHTPAQAEQMRLHPYLTEAILEPFPGLRAHGRLACQHHERLDGSGYPRGISGAEITPPARLLAAADMYASKSRYRPHRPATPATELPAVLRREVREGRLDAAAVEAVLVAAGHRRHLRREWPAGLTEREVEVLGHAARGRSNAEIAADLHVSPKTVGNHLDHIYTKTGARNRATIAVFAMRHGLLADELPPGERVGDGVFAP
ncbi:LuxR C-terminal-related transcriptional regulator [Agromyces sp. SYSU K20354]|uniref:HD domain-containing phosphohydrolase n=1 Tax=Agromyces cavernae TaxID=2898659 RepID=UPI001E4659DA|nr:HD domain-containing phosphohydrolase [Agromyces cavernae]MCD2443571.1 LuxR C-terminal-related transcriptional regulator [Agromyces cavernae]